MAKNDEYNDEYLCRDFFVGFNFWSKLSFQIPEFRVHCTFSTIIMNWGSGGIRVGGGGGGTNATLAALRNFRTCLSIDDYNQKYFADCYGTVKDKS